MFFIKRDLWTGDETLLKQKENQDQLYNSKIN